MDDECDAATAGYGHRQRSCSAWKESRCGTDHGSCVSMVSGHAREEKRSLCSRQPEQTYPCCQYARLIVLTVDPSDLTSRTWPGTMLLFIALGALLLF
eukprot:1091076-Pelagomonas_calceolata.AAC.5